MSVMQSKVEIFIQKATSVHADTYDYSKVSLNTVNDTISIICQKHGVFLQRATNHLQGRGCRKCSVEKVSAANRTTFDDFVEKANLVHSGFYSYPKQYIKRLDDRVRILCPKHGEFFQIGNGHLQGKQCIKCANRETLTTEIFTQKAKIVHGKAYGYDLVEYKNNLSHVDIRCPIHGVFKQAANHHLEGHGCKQCSLQNTQRRSIYKQVCKGKSSLYIIKCNDFEESFYKIGITKHKLKKRFNPSNMPYKFDVIGIVKEEAGLIWDLEKRLHHICRDFKYSPKKRFSGSRHECFKSLPKEVFKLVENLTKPPQPQLII